MLNHAVPHQTVLNQTVLNQTVLNRAVLNQTVLNRAVLNQTVPNRAVLNQTVLGEAVGPRRVEPHHGGIGPRSSPAARICAAPCCCRAGLRHRA